MPKYTLPQNITESYKELKNLIRKRLSEFEKVPEEKYFYELCYCICTPQSKASAAWQVQEKLENGNFLRNGFDPTPILFDKSHYIRFHSTKAQRLLKIREDWEEIKAVLDSKTADKDKRLWLAKNINGIGLKESAHFMRNIGYKNLGILDRHILKHLVSCGLYKDVPNISTEKRYLEVEASFKQLADAVKIPMDELDLLFWAYEAGEILK